MEKNKISASINTNSLGTLALLILGAIVVGTVITAVVKIAFGLVIGVIGLIVGLGAATIAVFFATAFIWGPLLLLAVILRRRGHHKKVTIH